MPRELILFLSSTQNRNVGTPIRVAVIASIVERYLAWCIIVESLVDQRLVPRCPHGDWNLVPSLRNGVRGGSRSLRRISGVIPTIAHNRLSMSGLAWDSELNAQPMDGTPPLAEL